MKHRVIVDNLKPLVPSKWRGTLVDTWFRLRRPTGSMRIMPHVLGIGAMRCGTSSLYKYLGGHPSVAPSLRKEIRFFSREYARGTGWYRTHFPVAAMQAAYRVAGRQRITFEISPDYMLSPYAAARAAQVVPDVKIIALLRDPVSRAHSHYKHVVAMGRESLSFEEALEREDERLAPELEKMAVDPLYVGKPFLHYSYKKRGLYAEQLERWFAVFPREKILVLDADRFFTEPASILDDILRFLELPIWHPEEFRNHSYLRERQRQERSATVMSPETRERLQTFFEEPNQRLRKLVGDDFRFLRRDAAYS